ncbi:hypothetical protein F503_03214 [Ophiostoma piceae UAMH 11346]|uniref:Uncharacterized protein n=1 Tax=Ophiostoma piceae (strain UAMH 11346) TaxID=1262450 RepID=S3C218_OPHP1|nr:hypothetical protein F503_03214 [Ophiostoma piceae UAMH 11346]
MPWSYIRYPSRQRRTRNSLRLVSKVRLLLALADEIVDQLHGHALLLAALAAGHDHVPHVPPRAVLDGLETPHLRRDPALAGIEVHDVAHQHFLVAEALDQKLVGKVLGHLSGRLVEQGAARDVAEEPVGVLAAAVVDTALLGGALDAAGDDLVDVDVLDGLGGVNRVLGGLRGGTGGLRDVQRHGGSVDALADEEADALERQHGLEAVGQGFVLADGLAGGSRRRDRRKSAYHLPFSIEVVDVLGLGGGHDLEQLMTFDVMR